MKKAEMPNQGWFIAIKIKYIFGMSKINSFFLLLIKDKDSFPKHSHYTHWVTFLVKLGFDQFS